MYPVSIGEIVNTLTKICLESFFVYRLVVLVVPLGVAMKQGCPKDGNSWQGGVRTTQKWH